MKCPIVYCNAHKGIAHIVYLEILHIQLEFVQI